MRVTTNPKDGGLARYFSALLVTKHLFALAAGSICPMRARTFFLTRPRDNVTISPLLFVSTQTHKNPPDPGLTESPGLVFPGQFVK